MKNQFKINIGTVVLVLAIVSDYFILWQVVNYKLIYSLLLVAVLIFLVKFWFDKREIKAFILLLCLLLVGAWTVVFFSTQDYILPIMIAISYSFTDYNVKKVIRDFTVTSAILFVLTIALHYFGVVKGNEIPRMVDGVVIYRDSLGFDHVNSVFRRFIPIFTGIFYLTSSRKMLLTYTAVELPIAFFLYLKTDSRTGFLLTALFLILSIFMKEVSAKLLSKLLYLFPIAAIILTLFFSYKFGLSSNFIDTSLSHRPMFWLKYLTDYRPTILGKIMPKNMPLDNIYLSSIYWRGLLISLLTGIFYLKLVPTISKDWKLSVITLFLLVYGIFEIVFFFSNSFLITVMIYLFVRKKTQGDLRWKK